MHSYSCVRVRASQRVSESQLDLDSLVVILSCQAGWK